MHKVLALVAAMAVLAAACGGAEKDPAEPTTQTSPDTQAIKSETPATTETPAEKPAPAPAPSYTHGKFVWFEHWAHDDKAAEATKAFYTDLFGWTFADQDMGGQKFTTINLADKPIGMVMVSDKVSKAKKALWMGYISVSDVDGSVAKAKEAGGKVHLDATDMEGVGRFAVLADKEGAVYGVVKTTSGDQKHGTPNPNEFWLDGALDQRQGQRCRDRVLHRGNWLSGVRVRHG